VPCLPRNRWVNIRPSPGATGAVVTRLLRAGRTLAAWPAARVSHEDPRRMLEPMLSVLFVEDDDKLREAT